MGTHPIFESDFDCLTDGEIKTRKMIIIDSQLENDGRVNLAAASLRAQGHNVRVLEKHSIESLLDSSDTKGLTFVLSEFDGDLFHRLEQSQGHQIVGKTLF